MSISISIYEKQDSGSGESIVATYICDSFNISAGGEIAIHFSNGDMVVGDSHHNGVVAYPHASRKTSVFDRQLLGD